MATTAKFPAAILALADVGGEWPSVPAQELVLLTTMNASVLTVVATVNIPATWPASGWLTIDNEQIKYDSFAAATFTINAAGRGHQVAYGGGAAAGHTAGATIGSYLTAQGVAQVVADLIEISEALMSQTESETTGAVTVNFALGATAEIATTGSITGITLSGGKAGQWHVIRFAYGGAHTIDFTTTVNWPGGTTPIWTSVSGKIDYAFLYLNKAGTKWSGSTSLNHADA